MKFETYIRLIENSFIKSISVELWYANAWIGVLGVQYLFEVMVMRGKREVFSNQAFWVTGMC